MVPFTTVVGAALCDGAPTSPVTVVGLVLVSEVPASTAKLAALLRFKVTFKMAVWAGRPPTVAVMVDVPILTPVARPGVAPPVVKIVATLVSLEVQAVEAVTKPVVPSLYVANAVNCCVPVVCIKAVAGDNTNDDTVTLVTVKVAVPGLPA